MSVELASRLAAWLSACLGGGAHPEEMEAALGPDSLHLVVGLEPETLSLTLALGALRRSGGTAASLALPVPGDPVGLAGPPAFNTAAMESGAAVVVRGSGWGLVPSEAGDVVTWQAMAAEPARALDPHEASSNLRSSLATATTALVELDVARWQPEIADALGNLRHRPAPRLPLGFADRVAIVDRAELCLDIVALARESDGAAVSAHEMQARHEALAPLDRAARHALVAACSGH